MVVYSDNPTGHNFSQLSLSLRGSTPKGREFLGEMPEGQRGPNTPPHPDNPTGHNSPPH